MKINVRGIRGKVNFGDDIGVLPLLDEDNLLDGLDNTTKSTPVPMIFNTHSKNFRHLFQ